MHLRTTRNPHASLCLVVNASCNPCYTVRSTSCVNLHAWSVVVAATGQQIRPFSSSRSVSFVIGCGTCNAGARPYVSVPSTRPKTQSRGAGAPHQQLPYVPPELHHRPTIFLMSPHVKMKKTTDPRTHCAEEEQPNRTKRVRLKRTPRIYANPGPRRSSALTTVVQNFFFFLSACISSCSFRMALSLALMCAAWASSLKACRMGRSNGWSARSVP